MSLVLAVCNNTALSIFAVAPKKLTVNMEVIDVFILIDHAIDVAVQVRDIFMDNRVHHVREEHRIFH